MSGEEEAAFAEWQAQVRLREEAEEHANLAQTRSRQVRLAEACFWFAPREMHVSFNRLRLFCEMTRNCAGICLSCQAAEQLRQAQTELASLVNSERTGAQVEAEARARFRSESTAADAYTGAWPYNRPCAQQYVGQSQSCMVISGRLIVHAPVCI